LGESLSLCASRQVTGRITKLCFYIGHNRSRLKERFSDVEDFTRILGFEVSLKRKDSDVGFVEKKFAFADANFTEFFSFPLRNGRDRNVLNEPYAVILTPASAEKYFGNIDPVGKSLLLNGLIELTVKDVFKTNFFTFAYAV
jgi:putative ABC transport system permease protein